MRRFLCVAILLGTFFFSIHHSIDLNGGVSAQSSIQLIPVVSGGLSSPLYVTHARDGSNRLFIVEQPGRILVLPPGASAPLATPFLDIRSKVVAEGERGLLGLAFHPQYKSNRRFFVNYTRVSDGATVISEFNVSTVDPNLAETSEKILLTIAQPFENHNGGMIEFGPDGYLYIGMGDGGAGNDPGNRAQNIEELLGKFLRIDVDTPGDNLPYSSPSTNPFVGRAGRDEIYATGMRNPFRWSFDRMTGELYAGDVGQNVIEEIDIITLGGNYGWRVLEGTRCTNLGPGSCTDSVYLPPIVQYNHSTNGRCSITGGYVYRGTRGSLPAGTYVYADFCSGEIYTWSKGMGLDAVNVVMDTSFPIASFGEDEAGEIYVVDLAGSVYRIAAVGGAAAAVTVSAATYRGESLAAGSIVTAFGTGFSTSTESASNGESLPTTLAGVTLRVTDALGTARSAPLFYVSPVQINFQLPQDTATGTAVISMNTLSGTVGQSTVNVAPVSPGLFTANSSGSGLAAGVVLRIKTDGTRVFEPLARYDPSQNQFLAIPIDVNSDDQVFLVGFGTGFRNRSALSGVTATVGGTAAPVAFAGAQGQFVGLDQCNIQLPRSLAGRGDVDVVMTVDGFMTNPVRMSIQ